MVDRGIRTASCGIPSRDKTPHLYITQPIDESATRSLGQLPEKKKNATTELKIFYLKIFFDKKYFSAGVIVTMGGEDLSSRSAAEDCGLCESRSGW